VPVVPLRPERLLNPSLSARSGGDAVTLLTVYICFLIGLPARFVVGPLGGAGAPAQVLAMGMALWWLVHWAGRPYTAAPVVDPVRRSMLVLVAAVLISYVVAAIRPIDPAELSAADRGLLLIGSWTGLLLLAADGIPSRLRLDTVLRRVAWGGGLVAAFALLQFQTGRTYLEYLHLPGLAQNGNLSDLTSRSGIHRPAGTATHPIEFAIVLSMLLPIALHYALNDTTSPRLRRWFPTAAIGIALPISVSRSAIVCTTVAMAVMVPSLPRAQRRVAIACTGAVVLLAYLLVPGLIGTLLGLFTGISSDSSALSRTDSYALAGRFITQSPVFGRGFSTFLPEYRILDNQYLLTLIETGVVGLLALLGVFVAGISSAVQVRRKSQDPRTRQLAQALAASLAAGAVSLALFDALSFPMVPGLIFLVLGVVSALRRLQLSELDRDVTGAEQSNAIDVAG
jgi:polysaccharide biosynthesis protein PslJ